MDEYKLAGVKTYPDGSTVRVFRPILTEEERNRRMEQIKIAAEQLLRDTYIKQQKRKDGVKNEEINH